MRPILPTAFLLAAVTAACARAATPPQPTITSAVSPTPTVSSPAATVTVTTPSPAVSPTPKPQVELPADAPRKFGQPLASDQVPLAELAPPGAQVTDSRLVAQTSAVEPEITLAWTRGPDPFAAEHGFEAWQRFPGKPAWRVVYAFTDAADSGVFGVSFESGDLTGDGIGDLLTFEDTGGSGACGLWRVVESGAGFASEIYRRRTCDTRIELGAGVLQVAEAVYLPGDAHCCPSKTRRTTLEWDGSAWQVTSRSVTPNR